MDNTSKKLFRESHQLREFIFAGIALFTLIGIAMIFLSLLAVFLAYYVV